MRSGIRFPSQKRELSTRRPAQHHAILQPGISIRDALLLIMQRRDIGPEAADQVLRDACVTGKVSARHILALTNDRGQKRIGFPKVPPDAWNSRSVMDVETNSLWAFEHGKLEHLQINKSELSTWLSRPRRGPKAGTLARFAESDRSLFSAIEYLMRKKDISLTEVARELVYQGKVNGRGTAESRIRRLTRIYRKERLGHVR